MAEYKSLVNPHDLYDAESVINSLHGADRAMREVAFERLQLAHVIGYEKDNDGRLTGYVKLELLTTPMVVRAVMPPMASSQAGYWFCGGVPPVNTMCLVGWLPMNIPVILSFYTHNIRDLKSKGVVPDLQPGEMYFRSQSNVSSGRAAEGSSVYLRGDGTLIAKAGTSTFTMSPDGTVTVSASVVHLGDANGDQLATKSFVKDVYDGHTHGPGSFKTSDGKFVTTGNSGSPSPTSDDLSYTDKTRAS